MARQFVTVDYAATLRQTVTLADCLPTDHLARFIVGMLALLDLRAIYARYAAVGGAALSPRRAPGSMGWHRPPRPRCWDWSASSTWARSISPASSQTCCA